MEEGKRLCFRGDRRVGAGRRKQERALAQQVTEYLNDVDREQAIFREGRRITLNVEKLAQFLKGVA
jgi:hypothetical protein